MGRAEYRFSVPFVEGQSRPRFSSKGKPRAYTDDDEAERRRAVVEAFQEVADGRCPAPPRCPVRVEIVTRRRLTSDAARVKSVVAEADVSAPDADNVAKLVLDALSPPRGKRDREADPYVRAWHDDSQVTQLSVVKGWRMRNTPPRTEVVVSFDPDWEPGDNQARKPRKGGR